MCSRKKSFHNLDLINYFVIAGEVYTPFMIAVRNGHTQLVTLLLERFDIDVSAHLATLKFDGYLIEGRKFQICNDKSRSLLLTYVVRALTNDKNYV